MRFFSIICALLILAGIKLSAQNGSTDTTLAKGNDKFVGCAYGGSSITGFANYWNQVTPENAGKWGSVEGQRDQMNWGGLDAAYQLAMDYNFTYRHHVLVWGSQQPGWMADLDSAQQREELQQWFDTVALRYPGIDQIEVVNEPLHQPPDDEHEGEYIGALGGSGETGWDWIIEAFRMARETFSDSTVLMINDYNIMSSSSNTDQYLEIINLLQEDSLIDAIGFQGHGFSHYAPNEVYLRNMDTLASTGLPLYVTELDIDGETDLEHVHGYMNLFPLLWEHPAVKGITLWGYRPGMWRTDQGAFLVDEDGEERPALHWLRAYLNDEFVANDSLTVSTSSGTNSIEANGGTLQMEAQIHPDTSTLKTVHWRVNNNVATINQNGVLTAQSNGTVTVTAMSLELDSDVSDQMEITISGQEDPTGVIENDEAIENIHIYPNPVQDGRISIEGIQHITSISILNINGQQVYSHNTRNQSNIFIDLDVPAGLYFVRLYDGNKSYHREIIIE